jgi:hypothetical protein
MGSFFTNLDPTYLLLAPVLSLITDTENKNVSPALSARRETANNKRKVVQCQYEKMKLDKLSYTFAFGAQYLKVIVDFDHDLDLHQNN